MSNLLHKIRDWYRKINTKKLSYETSGIKPKHDWMVVLSLMIILILIMGVTAFYFYNQINNNRLFIVESDSKLRELKLEEKLLKKIVGDIKSRAESLNAINNNKLIPPDPSV